VVAGNTIGAVKGLKGGTVPNVLLVGRPEIRNTILRKQRQSQQKKGSQVFQIEPPQRLTFSLHATGLQSGVLT
jgi:hypothetical protein